MAGNKIPIVIGVTGHRQLPAESVPALEEAINLQLNKIRALAPHSPVQVLSCLAEGADQLCAQAALEQGFALTAALPMPPEEYEKDFAGQALENFRALLHSAQERVVCPQTEPLLDTAQNTVPQASEGRSTDLYRKNKDYFYRQADIYVASHCHVLLAVWDGGEAKPGGCGTAETVAIMLHAAYADRPEHNLHPDDGAVIQIASGNCRSHSDVSAEASPEVSGSMDNRVGEVIFHGAWEQCRQVIAQTDAFNKEVEAAGNICPSDWIKTGGDPMQEKLRDVYDAADTMSLQNAAKYNRILGAFSVAATLLTIAFLVYDTLNLFGMIIGCAVMLAALVCIRKSASRLQCHEKYLEYRILAEGLRVQLFLNHAGRGLEAARLLPWPLQMHLPWIRKALAVLSVGKLPDRKQPVCDLWISDQMAYHKKALERTGGRMRASGTIVKISLIVTIALYVAALLFEIIAGGLSTGSAMDPQSTDLLRTVLKILMGSMSAVTVFVSNYFGKQSLEETADDHRRMIILYNRADEIISQVGETDELLWKLAKEELSENSSWYAYQRKNQVEIDL